jgi:6-pyruvoyltetrahydropterin/6-carboxytetrahydropterin synthase
MFEIEKSFNFEAGHVLKHHDGKCSQPHGHSYRLEVKVRSDQLISSGPKTNMVMDFLDFSAIVKKMIEKYFDHCWVNETLGTDSPTAEFMAKWIFDHLTPQLPGLYQVTLYETATSKATYSQSQS